MKFGRDGAFSATFKPIDSAATIQAELSADEELIWAGKPVSVLNHGKSSIPKMLFGIPFLGFAIFWTISAMGFDGIGFGNIADIFGSIFPLFGVPFIIIGLAMMMAPLWQMYKATKTTYGLSNKRLIIRENFPRITINSWPLEKVSKIIRYNAANNIGDIYFAEKTVTSSKGRTHREKVGFLGIENPRELENAIHRQLEQT